jgi:tetratricopeptide (TPR) repeat protein
VAAVATLVLLACANLTTRQVHHWRNTRSLFEHALRVNPENSQACAVVGSLLAEEGRHEEAVRMFEKALRLNPRQSDAQAHWGLALVKLGRFEEASRHYAEAVRIKPSYVEARLALGLTLHRQGRMEEAIEEFRRALALQPESAAGHNNLAMALYDHGQRTEAVAHLEEALRIDPGLEAARENLAVATGVTPRTAATLEASGEAQAAESHVNQASALLSEGRTREAVGELRRALALAPDSLAVLNNLAWILATDPDSAIRDSAGAVDLAERAVELTGGEEPIPLGTLAAAYAEAGRFDDAVATGRAAHELALRLGRPEVAETNLKLSELYRSGQPFRQTADPDPAHRTP